MSYLVLARKWRPQTFAEVLGQESVVRTLQNAIKQERLAHAFLFTGPRGVGKTSIARILAKAINCQSFDAPTPEPCGQCPACKDITAGAAVDVLEIDGASNRGIDNIRDLRETVRYAPSSFRSKVYIIDEVHMLTTESFNALLKTLEEPPPHVTFIFATTEVHKVPATILSRCQRYDFHRVGIDGLVKHLMKLLAAENVILPEGALKVIAREAEGSVRDSLSLLDQVLGFGAEGLTEDDIFRILGVVDRSLVFRILRSVMGGDPADALLAVAQADEAGHDVKQLAREVLRMFRNLIVIKLSKDPTRTTDLSESELNEVHELSRNKSLETLERLFGMAAKLDEELKNSSQPRALVEITLVRMAITPPVVPLAQLIARLEQIEKSLAQGVPLAASPEIAAPLFMDRSTAKPAEPPAAATSCGRTDASWDDFMGLLNQKDHMLHAFFSHAVFSGIAGKDIRLSFPPAHFAMENLKRPENAAKIKGFLVECFGDGFHLVFSEDQNLTQAAPRQNKYQLDTQRRKEAMDDPVVQALIDKLGGEIAEVKTK